jgi:hypothetical protein
VDEQDIDRLSSGQVPQGELSDGQARVATLLAALRAGPTPAELGRQSETVRAMAAARRPQWEGSPAVQPQARREARRRRAALGAVLALGSLSVTSSLAAAGVLPRPLQSLAADVLSGVGISLPDPDGPDASEAGRPSTRPSVLPPSGESPAAVGQPSGPPAAPPGQSRAPGTPGPATTPRQSARTPTAAVLTADAATSGTQLLVSFQGSGVGPGPATVTVRAAVSATYGCTDQRGGQDRLRRTMRVDGVSQAQGQFPAVGGRTGGTLTLSPVGSGGLTCPSGQALELVDARYSRIVVTDSTNGASTTIERTFRVAR